MKFETEGIVLKQIKTVGGRRMIVLLSARYGKISAGSRINEGGRNKSALAMRPFTYGRYITSTAPKPSEASTGWAKMWTSIWPHRMCLNLPKK